MTVSSRWIIHECVAMRHIKMDACHQKTQPWVLGFGLSVRGGQTDLTCRECLERPEDYVQSCVVSDWVPTPSQCNSNSNFLHGASWRWAKSWQINEKHLARWEGHQEKSPTKAHSGHCIHTSFGWPCSASFTTKLLSLAVWLSSMSHSSVQNLKLPADAWICNSLVRLHLGGGAQKGSWHLTRGQPCWDLWIDTGR